MFKKTALFVSLLLAANVATAGMVTNDTELLSAAGHEQISTWLGEDVDLTRIFEKGIDGTSGYDWHAAVDNQGRTFTIMEVFNGLDRRIIGGYNEYSWKSDNTIIRSFTTDNFLFNLTSNTQYQKNNSDNKSVFNYAPYNFSFGTGDLFIYSDMSGGRADIGESYGDKSKANSSTRRNDYAIDFAGSYDSWTIGKYETFTLSASTGDFGTGSVAEINELGKTVSNVPVTFAMGSLAMFGLGFGASRRRKSK
jgi:hypothetical protein